MACRLLRLGIYLHVPVPPSKNVFVRIALIENDTTVGTSDFAGLAVDTNNEIHF